jgi:hypothetical protein
MDWHKEPKLLQYIFATRERDEGSVREGQQDLSFIALDSPDSSFIALHSPVASLAEHASLLTHESTRGGGADTP